MNRNKISRIFVTFPQTKVLPEAFAKYWVAKCSYGLVVQESHKDGGKHLHAVLILKHGEPKMKLLKRLTELYPSCSKSIHLDAIKSLKGSMDYLDKEAGLRFTWGTLPLAKKKMSKHEIDIAVAKMDIQNWNTLVYQIKDDRLTEAEGIRLKMMQAADRAYEIAWELEHWDDCLSDIS